MSEVLKLLNQRMSQSGLNRFFGISSLTFSIGVMWLFTCSALIGISLGYLAWFIPKTPINLLLGFLLLIMNVPFGTRKGIAVFLISFLVGMGVEIAGVHTGDIFGNYVYGNNLGFKVWGVPLMIGIYWAVLVIVTSQISRSVFKNMIFASLFGAGLMVGLDFIMEHLASQYDFWHFEGGLAGAQNYLAWFVVAFSLQILASKWLPKGGELFSRHLYINQVVFFSVSYILLMVV